MDVSKLATKNQLVELEVSTPEIIESVGEPIVFWMKEHLDLGTYFDFYKFQQDQNINQLTDILRQIVLNSEGKPAIAEDETLPVEILLAILFKVNEFVGKPRAKVSDTESGKVQN